MTEAETVLGVTYTQDKMYAKDVVDSIDLVVELPMILEINNRGAVDMAQKNWQVVGQSVGRSGCDGYAT